MSRMSRESVFWRFLTGEEVHMPFESSEMREAIGLGWIVRSGDERMTPEELGRRIDDCLVEWISLGHHYLDNGYISLEDFEGPMRWIEEGMIEDADLRAFAATLERRSGLQPASETYLELTKREVLCGGKPRPSFKKGLQFASVLLADFIDQENWQIDWDGGIFTRLLVATWLNGREPSKLQRLIDNSGRSPTVWDALQQLCKALADRAEVPPDELMGWSFEATHGSLKRPDPDPAPRNRPRKLVPTNSSPRYMFTSLTPRARPQNNSANLRHQVLGYMLRDNEIRHTVDLLFQVGMPKNAGRTVVAEVLHLAESRIQQICREPYWTYFELREHAMKRLDPYAPHLRIGS